MHSPPSHESGFSLGSNLNDRIAHLRAARDALAALPDVRLVAQSAIYETEPVGVRPEYRHLKFLNAVVILEASMDPHAWLREIGRIETALGRVRTADRFAPRTVDIDLLYCGRAHVGDGAAVVPHPRWAERRFVVRPLADVRPDLCLPGLQRTVSGVLEGLKDPAGDLRLFATDW